MEIHSERVLCENASDYIGKEVVLRGWVKTRRDHGKLIFIDLRDGSAVIQVVVNPKVSEKAYFAAVELNPEDVIEIAGLVNKRPPTTINRDIKTGEVEIEAREIKVIEKAEVLPFEIDSNDLDLELPTLLDHRSLTLRNQKVRAIFTIQEAILEGFRNAAKGLGATEIIVPTIVGGATEGGAELFPLEYYGNKAYLSQSPQLYKQIMVSVFERVYTISHAYRAEPSVTTRHLSETTQLDMEIGFVEFEQLLSIFEKLAVDMINFAQEKCKDLFNHYGFEQISVGDIPRLTVRQAQEIIHKEFGRDSRKEKDLAPQDEVDICNWAKKNHGSDFVTITHFPTIAKPFYTMPDPDDSEYSLSYDLLFRGTEIMSGSQRISNYQQLIKSIKDRGMNPSDFGMYLMAFKYGMPPEGGFSFGLERVTMKLLNLSNIREASLFPRDMERIDERFSKKTTESKAE